jgi:hypothetical protein
VTSKKNMVCKLIKKPKNKLKLKIIKSVDVK